MHALFPGILTALVHMHFVIITCEDVVVRLLMHIQTCCLNASRTMGDTPALLARSPCVLILQSDPGNSSGGATATMASFVANSMGSQSA